MDWREKYKDKIVSIEDALKLVKSGDSVTTSFVNGIPYTVLDKLYDRFDELDDVEIAIALAVKGMRLFLPKAGEKFRLKSNFLGPIEREFKKRGTNIQFAPIHLSRIPQDRLEIHRPDMAVMAASPPDEDGYVSFGAWPMDAKIMDVRDVIIQVNENIPYIKGEGMQIKLDDATCIVDLTESLVTVDPAPPSEEEKKIAGHIMDYVVDGACIQLGIGGLANAVGTFLKEKKELGIHTEMFVESMIDLIESGAVTNSRKNIDTGKTIIGFGMGSQRMYDFLDHNEDIETRSFSYVNNPAVIGEIDNFVSINAALAVDLTGQCFSEALGFRQFSGSGGQVDFSRGAWNSKNGKVFICTPSTLKKKDGTLLSKIVLLPEPGSIVTTPRTDVMYVVTEYGVADLRNETIENRARRLIEIAHPDFREELASQAKEHGLIY
ncbi:MAG: 4-hydroxybutyrate CoA-transferase [Clostridiales Family XIII bacterium]|jgi:4-hydroxybutyrate CoA-transferase|nr:4-hydroxybutyrate CoA-transferase [Clostridiales Family XIII bacterium]